MTFITLLFFLALIFSAGLVLLPFPLKGKWMGLAPYGAFSAALAYVFYELSIPVRTDIRIDLFLVFPILAAAFLGGAVRWIFMLARSVRKEKSSLGMLAMVCSVFLHLGGFCYAYLLATVGDPYFAALKRILTLY